MLFAKIISFKDIVLIFIFPFDVFIICIIFFIFIIMLFFRIGLLLDKITNGVLFMIRKDLLSVSTAEKKGFQKLSTSKTVRKNSILSHEKKNLLTSKK